jgi:hypothetical protein
LQRWGRSADGSLGQQRESGESDGDHGFPSCPKRLTMAFGRAETGLSPPDFAARVCISAHRMITF